MSKGFTYLLARLRGTELLVGSEAQTIDEIKSLLVENGVPIESGLAELHQVGKLKIGKQTSEGLIETILLVKPYKGAEGSGADDPASLPQNKQETKL
ncbi:hypothetical protein [Pararhizobium sp. DWP1-1-3]|uniref:hypothetical protein n=1 Tax=Pararhizobium sp. DWP1-1-3 TaxID=2804652 RepID=UPI003CF8ACFA